MNLKVEAISTNNKKNILNNVSGYALQGQLTAIMGPSGELNILIINPNLL